LLPDLSLLYTPEKRGIRKHSSVQRRSQTEIDVYSFSGFSLRKDSRMNVKRFFRSDSLLCLLGCGFLLIACSSTPGSGGINSAPGITDRLNTATIHPLGLATVTASCQAGEQMLSGGWSVTTPAYRQGTASPGGLLHNVLDEYFIAASYPSSPNSYRFLVRKPLRPVPDLFLAVLQQLLSMESADKPGLRVLYIRLKGGPLQDATP
jgi:hypothetical protein